jgi:hypothetical protein
VVEAHYHVEDAKMAFEDLSTRSRRGEEDVVWIKQERDELQRAVLSLRVEYDMAQGEHDDAQQQASNLLSQIAEEKRLKGKPKKCPLGSP